MSQVETVFIVREDLPGGKLLVNLVDVQPGDVIWSPEQKAAPVKKRRTVKRGDDNG